MEVVKLFSNCIPVKGYKRSIICDLQLGRYKFIPNDLFDIIQTYEYLDITFLREKYGHSNEAVINSYIDFIINDSWGFYCDLDALDNFPPIVNDYVSPSKVENAILDFSEQTIPKINIANYERAVRELSMLGCVAVMLRFFSYDLTNEIIFEILNLFRASRIKEIVLVVKYSDKVDVDIIPDLFKEHLRVAQIIIHGAPHDKSLSFDQKGLSLIQAREPINDATHCGFVSKRYFNIEIQSFFEAQHFNSCLNRKICIDHNGEMKNCPSFSTSFGNIMTNNFAAVIENDKFRAAWEITKDMVDICKVCEFRYICLDCRAFTTDLENPHAKPLHCQYDPLTATWA
ncbi:grasp-with-spasm system SPASM domain peptide maturase [Dyadobacter endophyticus]|uniref:grasp-with-spasm system SPASM domain peptide maturase n=1 Tax=Dyadobacter TaxID=120831 RepID=UPI003CEDA8A9